jgi:hypothetical protein
MAAGPPRYEKNHGPFSYFSDVAASSAEAADLVPFSQFSSDLASGRVPNFSFVLPNSIDDAHDETLRQADTWLQQNIGPLVSSPTFQSSLLIIVFDESDDTDTAAGGGHVPAVIVSPKAKAGYKSTTTYQTSEHPAIDFASARRAQFSRRSGERTGHGRVLLIASIETRLAASPVGQATDGPVSTEGAALYLVMTPQAMRSPEFPAGSVFMSSSLA